MGIGVGIFIVLGIACFFAFLTIKSKNNDLFKWVGIALFIAFCLTWVLPNGRFAEGEFTKDAIQRLGIFDLSSVAYYSLYFCLTTVLFLFMVGGFYGVLSKSPSYQALVKKVANFVKSKKILVTAVLSSLIMVLVSFTGNTFAWIVFMPFLVSVLLNAKLDKMTTFATTYGSMLAGILATTYGTGSLSSFNYYVSTGLEVGLKYRLILAFIALVAYVVFNALVLKHKLTKKHDVESDVDLFEIEDSKTKKGISVWYPIVVFVFLFIFTFLGLFRWAEFKIDIFESFHTWLTELQVGEDFTIMSYILGSQAAVPFGQMEVTHIMIIVLVITVITGIVNRMSLKDFMDSFGSGFVKFVKPVCLFILSYSAFVVVYMTPITATMINWFITRTKTFNPFLTTLSGLVASFFHADLGYTGYIVGSVITTKYEAYQAIVHTIYVSTYGIVQLLLPTSGILLFGLSYLKLDYKSWFKHIWLVAIIMIVALIIVSCIVRYA